MDWIQWYYAFWLSVSILIRVAFAMWKPNEKPEQYEFDTYSFRAALIPIQLTVALPIIGRMFNWW